MPFIGRYYHALEQKGRLSIPSSFRSRLGGQVVLTAGLDGCLFLFDSARWDQLLESTHEMSITKRQNRDWIRYLANNAEIINIDNQGRILIPEYLRTEASLKQTVVIVGSVDRIELWDQVVYHDYRDNLNQHINEITEAI